MAIMLMRDYLTSGRRDKNMLKGIFFAAMAISTVSGVMDVPFLQDISHRSTAYSTDPIADWDVLQFDTNSLTSKNVIHLTADSCFVVLVDNVLYSSSRKVEFDKMNLENPYQKFTTLFSLNENALALTESHDTDYSFYVTTESNILRFKVGETNSSSCGSVELVNELIPSSIHFGKVLSTTSSPTQMWIVSTELGLSEVSLSKGSVRQVDVNGDSNLSFVHWVQAWQKLYVASPLALYTLSYVHQTPQKITHEWIGAILDTIPLDMAYDEAHDALWIAEDGSVHKLTREGRYWRLGQRQGAPTGNITSVAASEGYIWVGSAFGISRVSGDADVTQKDEVALAPPPSPPSPWTWLYLSSHRFLPLDTVTAVVAGAPVSAGGVQGSLVLAITPAGVALLEASPWTLADKAVSLGSLQMPRHNRHGLTTGVTLTEYGDLASYEQECDDNDGLWTSMHAMGEVYRYLTTGETEAREWAWAAFEGLEMLSILPGAYPTFPARSFCTLTESDSLPGCSGEPWVPSEVDTNYMWKSTTSSDELDGHLAIYPLIYDHIASSDQERDRVYNLIEGITGGILANDLYLIDPSTGQPTTWGFWNPALVNDDPDHYSERGANSLGILAYCASAYSITHDTKYKDMFWDLAVKYDYLANCLNAKIDCPVEDNHSDNELLMQAYHILFYALNRLTMPDAKPHMQAPVEVVEEVRRMVEALVPSIDRMWTIVKGELSPLWVGIYAGTAKRPVGDKDISDAVWTLRHWAIDMVMCLFSCSFSDVTNTLSEQVNWPIHNDNRWDITESPYYARDSTEHLMRQIRPPQERVTAKWNSDPFVMSSGNGMKEEYPGVWRLPYYLMLYNNLITAM